MNIPKIIPIALISTISILLWTNSMAAFFTKKSNQREFAAMLQQRPISGNFRIDNIKIKGFEFPVKAIELIHFSRNQWDEINATGRTFTNIVFEDCKINNSDFTGITLENVLFKNCEFHNVIFNHAQFDNLVFEGSKLSSNDPNIDHSYIKMKGQSLHFNQSKLNNINLTDGKFNLFFKNSELYRVDGYGLEKGSSITIENTNAESIDFSFSTLSSLTIKNSHIQDSKANDATIEKVVFENSNIKFPIANGKFGTITTVNTKDVAIGLSKVKQVFISNCGEGYGIHVARMTFESITIEGCSASKLLFYESRGKQVKISNSTFFVADFGDADIENLSLENIRIRDELHYENAKVGTFIGKNITRDKDVKVFPEGANFKIEFTD